MKKIKKLIKQKLKDDGIWNIYKSKFVHKDTRFPIVNLSIIYDINFPLDTIYLAEKKIMNSNSMSEFGKCFSMFQKYIELKNNDLESLGRYFWYVYNVSIFSSKKLVSIYTWQNYIQLNNEKRELFYKWMHSLMNSTNKFNVYILRLRKLGL